MEAKQLVVLAFQVAIIGTVFGFGLRTTRDDALYLVRRPGLLLRSLLSVFVVMPILAVIFVRVFDFRQTAEIAIVALAVSPVPPLLPTREIKAGGRTSYALSLMFVLALVSIVAVPLLLGIFADVFDRELKVAPSAIARVVLMSIVLPLLVGIAVRAWWPRAAAWLVVPVRRITTVLLALAVACLLAASWGAMRDAMGEGAILAIVVFVIVGLAVGHLLGGPEREHSVVLALSTACRHPAIALAIAAANYSDLQFVGTILLYLIINMVVAIPYVAWQRKRAAREGAAVT